jgi:AcrR family transcriptional regulator
MVTGKLRRREQILAAARLLVRASGVEGFTMRTLANRSNVAFVTLYNHFGSKRAILSALATPADLDPAPPAAIASDSVEAIFSALDRFTEHYLQDPKLFRPVWLMLFEPTNEPDPVQLPSLQAALAPETLPTAQAQGVLISTLILPDLFALLDLLMRSALHAWASGTLPQSRLRPTVCFGSALILAGAATPTWRKPLQERALEWQSISNLFPPDQHE